MIFTKNNVFLKTLVLVVCFFSCCVLSSPIALAQQGGELNVQKVVAIRGNIINCIGMLQNAYFNAVQVGNYTYAQQILINMQALFSQLATVNCWLFERGITMSPMPTFPSYVPNTGVSSQYWESKRAKAAAEAERTRKMVEDSKFRLSKPYYGG